MRVLVTGATGFTGSHVVASLLRNGHDVACFVRSASSTEFLPVDKIELRLGDLGDPASLTAALSGMDALVNVPSLAFGHAQGIIDATKAAGIQRAIFVSTTQVETSLNAASKSVRLAAEAAIRRSNLAYTILRPTMIYGSSRDRNISRLIRYLQKWPIIPVFGDGCHLQQPVHVEDVAEAMVQSLESDKTIGKTYNVSGAVAVSYNELIDTVCVMLKRSVRKVHVPSAAVVWSLRGLERMGLRLPIESEQVVRLNEDKAFSYEAAKNDFGYHPRTVAEGLKQQIEGESRELKGS